jgi:manganese transport protein
MQQLKIPRSLEEVHGTVDPWKRTGWRKILAFFGPAYLVSVGYMDPGNWATDIAGGSKFGYTLIWVLLMSNIMALLLQSFSARLGIVRGRDLAQASRESYPSIVNIPLYILAEIAIAACDLAEVLGMAIGLYLLFDLPILYGVAITVLDTLVLLFLQRFGMRKMEMFIVSLVLIIGMSFFVELVFAKPDLGGVVRGFKPAIPGKEALYIAIGIIGATVMPHNLYLHSALVQTRKIDREPLRMRMSLKYNFIDSAIALNMAFLVNASILILAASTFFSNNYFEIKGIIDAHKLLQPLLGEWLAPILFAIALIASGQSSTVTGTLAGQIIMEGYIHLRLPMWLRRLITRMLAVIPAFFVVLYFGENATEQLLILSQVILSLQLAYAVIPLIHFVSDRKYMGEYTVRPVTQIIAWVIAIVIVTFNVILTADTISSWFETLGSEMWWVKVVIILVLAVLAVLLLYVTFSPLIKRSLEKPSRLPHGTTPRLDDFQPAVYNRIAMTVDFSDLDRITINHALSQGNANAQYILIHIVETAPAILSEKETGDLEAGVDMRAMNQYVGMLREKGYNAEYRLGYGRRSKGIAEIVKESKVDLLVMGAHGHSGIKDMFLGETINAVRHLIEVPLLVVK